MREEAEHPPNKDMSRYQHLELKPSQSQRPRHQSENTMNKSQNNMSPLELTNPATAGPEYCNTAESSEKNI